MPSLAGHVHLPEPPIIVAVDAGPIRSATAT